MVFLGNIGRLGRYCCLKIKRTVTGKGSEVTFLSPGGAVLLEPLLEAMAALFSLRSGCDPSIHWRRTLGSEQGLSSVEFGPGLMI